MEETGEVLDIIRQEMLRQSQRHNQAAMARISEFKSKSYKSETLFSVLRLALTSEALANFSQALTEKKFKEWRENVKH